MLLDWLGGSSDVASGSPSLVSSNPLRVAAAMGLHLPFGALRANLWGFDPTALFCDPILEERWDSEFWKGSWFSWVVVAVAFLAKAVSD